jgi:hypothetical protein
MAAAEHRSDFAQYLERIAPMYCLIRITGRHSDGRSLPCLENAAGRKTTDTRLANIRRLKDRQHLPRHAMDLLPRFLAGLLHEQELTWLPLYWRWGDVLFFSYEIAIIIFFGLL